MVKRVAHLVYFLAQTALTISCSGSDKLPSEKGSSTVSEVEKVREDAGVLGGPGRSSEDSGAFFDAGDSQTDPLGPDADLGVDSASAIDSSMSVDAQRDGGGQSDSSCPWKVVFPKIGAKPLRALWGSAPDDVYAVGDEGTLLHYDGKNWAKIAVGIADDLYDIWGSNKNNIYAVGGGTGYGGKIGSVALRFDGHSWSRINLGSSSSLKAVWGSGAQDIFIAGRDYIWHFDGTTWKTSPTQGGQDWTDIFGCGSDAIYAVEGARNLYRFDGSSWIKTNTQAVADGSNLLPSSVWCSSAADIWFFSYAAEGPNGVMRWDGTSWTALKTRVIDTANYKFLDMFETSDGSRYLFGEYGGLFRFEAGSWRSIATGTHESINAVWGADSSQLFLAGGGGLLLKLTSNGIEDFNGNIQTSLTALLDTGSDSFAAVSQRADLVLGDAQQTRVQAYTGPANFIATTTRGTRADDIYIGGYQCLEAKYNYNIYDMRTYSCESNLPSPALVHYDGTRFAQVDLGASFRRWRDFDGSGNTAPVYVDNFGKVGSLQNSAMIDFPQQPPIPALNVAKSAAGDVYAVSSLNRVPVYSSLYDATRVYPVVLYRWEKQSWTVLATIEMADVVVNLGFGRDARLYLIGQYGTVYRYEANALQLVANTLPEELRAYRNEVSWPFAYAFPVVNATNDIYLAPGILHYNGFRWELLDDNGTFLDSVFELDSGDLYAVKTAPAGKYGATYSLMRYQGLGWSNVSLPETVSTSPPAGRWPWVPVLSPIWGASPYDFYLNVTGDQIWHYNGITWSPSLNTIGKPITFAGTNGSEIWAASYFGDVFRNSQGSWRTEREAVPCDKIVSIQQQGDNLYAVCDYGHILRRTGNDWRSIPFNFSCVGAQGRYGVVNDTWSDDPQNLFVSGAVVPNVFIPPPFICHFDGEHWNPIPNPSGSPKMVWGTTNDVYSIFVNQSIWITSGNQSESRYCAVGLEHYDGTAWTLSGCGSGDIGKAPNTDQWITSGPSHSDFVFDADTFDGNNSALYYNGSRWTSFSLPDVRVQWSIGDPHKEMFTASDEGAIYYQKCP